MNADIELIATTSFGLEAVVSRELKALGYEDQTVADGKVTFRGGPEAICRANLWLRSADRVVIKIGEFEATDFGALFDQCAALDWARWIPENGQFPVSGKSVRSQLQSVRDCQALVKKAIVEKLKQTHHVSWFAEKGPLFSVQVSLLKDVATLTLDTTGPGLHKRGYRTLTGPAPLKETLAAALIQLSYWTAERPFLDPFCGTGTIPIEAALWARNRAPGLARQFAADDWPTLDRRLWHEARQEANDRTIRDGRLAIVGSDIDEPSLAMSRKHARQAGVEADIRFERRDFFDAVPQGEFGCLIANPPYGERSGDVDAAEDLVRAAATVFKRFDTWSIYILSALANYEQLCGRHADRRRKLYNGRIACTYYQFHGPRPPKPTAATEPAPASHAEPAE
ncbi:MAG TPA: class I SAM-dependent RNA methyltransferase [Planctomycetaceae bacterium]|nr:class I SAM-dependent RNA methyltransferase [Planctomycetaceae bacterium]